MEYKQFMQRLVGLGLGPGPIQDWSWITQKQTHNWDCSSMNKKHGCHDFPIDGDYYHGHDPTAPRTFSSLKIGI
jgi:hypothetical protein